MLFSKTVNRPNEAISSSEMRKISAEQMTAGRKSPAIFQRIARADMNAVRECLDHHGNLVWAAARRKYTHSTEEAEAATEEIFLDLWKHADRFDSAKYDETGFVLLIARRRLLKSLRSSAAGLKLSENAVKNHTDKRGEIKFGCGEFL